ARPALQLPVHVRAGADPARPDEAAVRGELPALLPAAGAVRHCRPRAVHLPGLPGVRAGRLGPGVRGRVAGAHPYQERHDRPGRDRAARADPGAGHRRRPLGDAGVLAAPMRAVNPLMGADLIITVFAVVVIGGLGSVFGSVTAGFAVGLVSALGNLYVPALSQTLVFILMAAVLLWRPAGLFGREEAFR